MIQTLREIVKYRPLIRALVVRHLVMRYRGSVLGFLWSILNPLCLMLVYTLVFKFYIRFNEVEHYTIFLFAGLLPWIWCSSGLLEGTASISSGGHLITKSMFPAHILPIVAVLTTMINFLLSLPLLFIFMAVLGVQFHASLALLPFIVLLQMIFLTGLVLGLSSLNVHFRDMQHILANLLTLLFFLCPIIYPPHVVPEALRFTLEANPFALFTIIYQNAVLDGVMPSAGAILTVLGYTLAALIFGDVVYNRYRESFAELL
jgi:ABC-type polysaccharide/polyol phosphate export permease